MDARTESLRFPHTLEDGLRRFFASIAGWAMFAAVMGFIRRYTREPSLPRMSDEWLLNQQRNFDRLGDYR